MGGEGVGDLVISIGRGSKTGGARNWRLSGAPCRLMAALFPSQNQLEQTPTQVAGRILILFIIILFLMLVST